MAESQLECLEDEQVNVKTPECSARFYYSEEQRGALEQLLRNGEGAFKMRLKQDNIGDFLSAREMRRVRKSFRPQAADSDGDSDRWEPETGPPPDSGVHSTYWPQLSDTEVPPLDIGWPDGGFYKGVTRVSVHTHPPKEKGPHIKQVVRTLIQEAAKVIAIVMDLLTDLHILQDLLDAASKRSVSVYIILEAHNASHFLDMCRRLHVTALHLRNMRVRTVEGCGLALSIGKLPGALCSKYMLVDAEKVMFGSYSFCWCSSRMDRNLITVMTGQVVDMFDTDFRELYAISEKVDLYKEFHVAELPLPVPVPVRVERRPLPPPLPPASRYELALSNPRHAHLQVPAHKYHNPKYSLVVGSSLGLTRSLQDLSNYRDIEAHTPWVPSLGPLQASSEKLEKPSPPPTPATPMPGPSGGTKDVGNGIGGQKHRSSFRHLMKGRASKPSTEGEGPATPSPTRPAPKSPYADEMEDKFEIILPEKPPFMKGKNRKVSKLGQKSVSMQAVNLQDEDGFKVRRRYSKKACAQS